MSSNLIISKFSYFILEFRNFLQGQPGVDGMVGYPGPQGDKGEPGEPGEDGYGVKGAQGEPGDMGISGPPGRRGPRGGTLSCPVAGPVYEKGKKWKKHRRNLLITQIGFGVI